MGVTDMRKLLSLGVVIFLAVAEGMAGAAPPARGAATPAGVPDALRPWIPWVMHDHEQDLCPNQGDERVCAWGGRLELSLGPGGGRFSQTWELAAEEAIPLPGGVS